MALITCPECGSTVSDKAEKCPQCAFPINEAKAALSTPKNIKTEVIVKPKEGCFLQTLNVGCMIIAVILGFIGLIVLLVGLM